MTEDTDSGSTAPDAAQTDAILRRALYSRWIAANAWGESAGLGTTFVIGTFMAPRPDSSTGASVVLALAVAAVLLGMLLEGVVVGVAQEGVLRPYMTMLRRWKWISATTVGAGLAWLLGLVPSTIMALRGAPGDVAVPEPSTAVQYALVAALGAVLGPILAAAQWTLLRTQVRHASRWLLANSAAWAIGMPVIFAGMDRVPWGGHPVAVIAAIYVVCGLAGLVVGVIHGQVLVKLVREAGEAAE